MRRFRLLSFVVAMLTSSMVLGVNLRGSWHLNENTLHHITRNGFYDYGWPVAFISYEAHIFPLDPGSKEIDEAGFNQIKGMFQRNSGEDYILVSKVDLGILFVRPEKQIHWNYFAINLFAILIIVTLVIFACEYILRRRDARAKAKVAA